MSNIQFFRHVRRYHPITITSEQAWSRVLRQKIYRKGAALVRQGQVPRSYAFICSGLAYQSHFPPDGEMIIKYFFPENRIAASISAMLTGTPSDFAITAIEDTLVLEYDFNEFKNLVKTHADIALFHINYLEKHWVVEKEPLEIAFRTDTAAKRYQQFLQSHGHIVSRLKKHHIASYLGISPTQLSRIIRSK